MQGAYSHLRSWHDLTYEGPVSDRNDWPRAIPADEPRLEAWERRTDYPLTGLAVLYLAMVADRLLALSGGIFS